MVVGGDITNFGGRDDANQVLDRLVACNSRIYGIPGNCDRADVDDALVNRSMSLHATMKRMNDVIFFGIGGCNKTPFHTPQEYSEKELNEFTEKVSKSNDARHYVVVSHAPPYKTKLDRVFFGFHVGSKAIRNFVEAFQPDLVLCGHIHEARGFDYIGRTLIINPGPFPKHYAIIENNDVINYRLL